VTPAFARHGDGVRMQLRSAEVELLRRLRDEMVSVLTEAPPDDPVRARLFPTTVTGDEDADADLRGMIHDELLLSRLTALDDLLALLDRGERVRGRWVVDLAEEEPTLVLGILNDIRLALGARVGWDVVSERDAALDDEAVAGSLAVMDHLAGWQEQLIVVLDPDALRHYDEGHDPEDED
jgi:hypothetical protein